ncbi:hypothetical protein GM921_06410 [Pedobacter sp. LMG 31464]|uniref:YceI-like domain-containing protein n=1 Tax=Pedobacter planticolens TaxID=2679964 RepID=A0A923DXY1_9SPHI|nr:hypothetical protein [Pedobacter planticolens]MBB2145106.1 hypothetical protein [Pedobacter planticolens]
MKNYYDAVSNFKSITLFSLILTSILFVQSAKAQTPYKVEGDSQIKISIDSNQNISSSLSAEGNFIVKDGILDEINSFELALPSFTTENKSITNKAISFKLTHVMILPTMKMIHAVGVLNIGGVSNRTDIEFSFVMNNDQSITLNGSKSIKLSDYHQESTFALASLSNNDDLKLNMNLVFKNNPFYTNNVVTTTTTKMTALSARD